MGIRKVAIAVVLVMAAAACTSTEGTKSAKAGAPPEIVSPADGSLVTGATVAVKVKAGDDARGLQVLLDGRPITTGFGGNAGGLREVTLQTGPGKRLDAGSHHLSVRANGPGAGTTKATFVVGKPDPGYLGIGDLPSGPTVAPVVVDMTTRSTPKAVTARLNGRDISGALTITAGHVKPLRLGAHEGLRPGQNTLEITGYASNGSYETVSRRLDISTDHPLVGAGRDARAKVGDSVQLDAGSSVPSAAHGALKYEWSIAKAPAGSQATVSDATSAKPVLKPDVPGTYALHLKATESAPGREPVEAQDAVSVSATPNPLPIGMPIETMSDGAINIDGKRVVIGGDWVQVAVVDRRNGEVDPTLSHGFNRGEEALLRETVNPHPDKDHPNKDYLVVISGAGHQVNLTPGEVDALDYAFKNLGGTLRPFNQVRGGEDPGWGSGQWSLVGVPGWKEGQATQAGSARTGLGKGNVKGYLQLGSTDLYDFTYGDYVPFDSAVPGQTEGANLVTVGADRLGQDVPHEVPAPATFAAYPAKAMAGGHSGFQVVILDQATLDLAQNETFVTNTPAADIDAIKAMSLLISDYVHRNDPALVIVQSIGRPKPLESTWTNDLAPVLTSVGASPEVFNNLNAEGRTPGGYSLVGGVRLGATDAAEASESAMGTSARITGMLSRNRQGQFRAAQASPTDKIDLSLLPLAYQTPSLWPTPASPGQEAATQWIAQHSYSVLHLPDDIRSHYTEDQSNAAEWSNAVSWVIAADNAPERYCPAGTSEVDSTSTSQPTPAPQPAATPQPPTSVTDPTLASPPPSSASPTSDASSTSDTTLSTDLDRRRRTTTTQAMTTTTTQATTTTTTGGPCVSTFTEYDYDTVAKEFAKEFAEVGYVRAAITAMKLTTMDNEAATTWDAYNIANDIETSLKPPSSGNSFVINLVLTLVSDLMKVTAMAIGAATGGTDVAAVAPWVGVLSSTVSMGMEWAQMPDGTSAAAPIEVRAGELASQIDAAYQNYGIGLDHVGDLLVTDHDKLATASLTLGRLGTKTTTEQRAMTHMKTATDQLIYKSLMPLVYQDYELRPGPGTNSENSYDAGSYNCFALANSQEFQPFKGASAQDQYQSVAVFDGDKAVRYVHVLATGNESGAKYEFRDGSYPYTTYGASLPSGSLVRDLFTSPPPGGSGVGFAPAVFFGDLPHIVVQCLRPL